MVSRHLTQEEINTLLSQNCVADNWDHVSVNEKFIPDRIFNTRFEGNIKLGDFSGNIEADKNIFKKCGIYNSSISDCEIADHVLISEVKNLSNYIVETNVVISNVGTLAVSGETTFGNGTEIEVLNEGGGRELPIFDRLSSQIAYLAVLYRHDKDFTEKILEIIKSYCTTRKSRTGRIQSGARIKDSVVIHNVSIGSYATVSGSVFLEEGAIESSKDSPAFVGEGVIAKKFIILSGSRVDGSAILDKTFVGQGVKIGKQYSAENSVFFANCEAFHGEACSLFAGPYTVTHHKSTLMIASLASFFNAGSGTNQSNHMYKLGPVHQGILDRGSKTGSFSYLLLPSHIGAFSVVMGKHGSNFDTSDFPFSYIAEEKGKSELTPAMNLFTVGTRRDSEKWPSRDRRTGADKLDLIHFDLFNPYIVARILNGIRILEDLAEKTDKSQEYVSYKGINIRRLLLKTTKKYYEMSLKVYLGQEIVKRIKTLDDKSSVEDLRNMLKSTGDQGVGKWADVCGMLSPASKIDELTNMVKSGKINSIDQMNKSLADIYVNYDNYAWVWFTDLVHQLYGDKPESLTIESLIQVLRDWKTSAIKLNNMILKDAEKEFDPGSKIGFGLDGDTTTTDMDFEAVRGLYTENKFVTSLQKESKEIEEKAGRLIMILDKLK